MPPSSDLQAFGDLRRDNTNADASETARAVEQIRPKGKKGKKTKHASREESTARAEDKVVAGDVGGREDL